MTWRAELDATSGWWAVVSDAPLGITVRHGIESHGSPLLTILYESEWAAQQAADELNHAEDA